MTDGERWKRKQSSGTSGSRPQGEPDSRADPRQGRGGGGTILHFTPKNGARIAEKLLKSAVANAVNREGKVRVSELVVRSAVVGAGPTMKRFLPRAQGRATPLLKRTSHLTITVGTRA